MRRLRPASLAPVAALVAGLAAAPSPALGSGALVVRVLGEDGQPVSEAVVYALPLDAPPVEAVPARNVEIDQVDKEFVPHVTAVPVGTRVDFPNSDNIRHHVYSFSEAKTFEIPLYEDMPAEPIEFDAPGEVVLGCNIHDWMRAYVFVVPTPWFAVSDAQGEAELDPPTGEYRVEVWHARLDGEPADTGRRVRVREGRHRSLELSIPRKRVWVPRRAPSLREPSYR